MATQKRSSQLSIPWWGWLLYLVLCVPAALALVGWGGRIAWSGFRAYGWGGVESPLEVPELAALVEDGVPVDLLTAYDTCTTFKLGFWGELWMKPLPPSCELFPITLETGWEGRIGVATITPINGLWSGEGPILRVLEPYQAEVEGETHTDTWDKLGMGLSGQAKETTAWIEVNIPPPPPSTLHRTLRTQVRLSITAPGHSGLSSYSNRTWGEYRDLNLFVVSGKEMETIDSHYATIDGGELFAALGVLLIGVVSGLALLVIPIGLEANSQFSKP